MENTPSESGETVQVPVQSVVPAVGSSYSLKTILVPDITGFPDGVVRRPWKDRYRFGRFKAVRGAAEGEAAFLKN